MFMHTLFRKAKSAENIKYCSSNVYTHRFFRKVNSVGRADKLCSSNIYTHLRKANCIIVSEGPTNLALQMFKG